MQAHVFVASVTLCSHHSDTVIHLRTSVIEEQQPIRNVLDLAELGLDESRQLVVPGTRLPAGGPLRLAFLRLLCSGRRPWCQLRPCAIASSSYFVSDGSFSLMFAICSCTKGSSDACPLLISTSCRACHLAGDLKRTSSTLYVGDSSCDEEEDVVTRVDNSTHACQHSRVHHTSTMDAAILTSAMRILHVVVSSMVRSD